MRWDTLKQNHLSLNRDEDPTQKDCTILITENYSRKKALCFKSIRRMHIISCTKIYIINRQNLSTTYSAYNFFTISILLNHSNKNYLWTTSLCLITNSDYKIMSVLQNRYKIYMDEHIYIQITNEEWLSLVWLTS